MKKILLLLISSLLVITLTSCGNKTNDSGTNITPSNKPVQTHHPDPHH